MLKRLLAVAQTGAEAVRWLGSEPYTESRIRDQLAARNYGSAVLNTLSSASNYLPTMNYEYFVRRMLNPDHDLIAVGAEATVLDCGGSVMKYLTGKSQDPYVLVERLTANHEAVSEHLSDYLPPTDIDVSRTKIFKHLPAQNYVRITQPKIIIDKADPHSDGDFLNRNPAVVEQLGDFARLLVRLFEAEGLLMDIVNRGNLVWGRIDESKPSRLLLIDTIPVDIAEEDFTGIHVPLWTPALQLETLTSFAIDFSAIEV